MKKYMFTMLIISSGILACSLHQAFGQTQTVTLCEDPWPPYTVGKDTGTPPEGGTAVAYLSEVFGRIEDVDLQMLLLPWKRCLDYVKEGDVDGAIILLYEESRAEYMTYSDPYYISRSSFFYLKERFPDGFSWNTLSDLSPYIIGIVEGFSYGQEFEDAVQAGVIKVDPTMKVEFLIKKLKGGRMDLFAANEMVGKAIIKQLGYEDLIVAHPKPHRELKYYMTISNRSSALPLLPKINASITKTIEDGTRDRLMMGE